MTYRKLIDSLGRIPSNRLDDYVTVFDVKSEELFYVHSLTATKTEEHDELEDGHIYLGIIPRKRR